MQVALLRQSQVELATTHAYKIQLFACASGTRARQYPYSGKVTLQSKQYRSQLTAIQVKKVTVYYMMRL